MKATCVRPASPLAQNSFCKIKVANSGGFKYLGPVTVYSHLQACGIVNDHLETCPRYAVVNAATEVVRKRRFRESGIVDFSRRMEQNIQ